MPRFDSDWRRVGVALGMSAGEQSVLGLARNGEVVVELDDTATPVPISRDALTLIDRYEDSWPDVRPENGDRALLARESPVIRHALLDRLAAEAPSVQPELFYVLPWELVRELANELAAALAELSQGRPGQPSPIRLRHWFTPTGSRFSAALDQFNAGVEDDDPALLREAGTALCVRLLAADLRRFPESARVALAELVRGIARRDPLVADTAVRAADVLEGARPGAARGMHVQSELELAASGEDQRELNEEIRLGPLLLDTDVTQGGMLAITAEFELTPDQIRGVNDGYGSVIIRLQVTDENDVVRRVLIPMVPSPPGLSGSVDLVAPGGEVAVMLEGAPIGMAESWGLDPHDVAVSYDIADAEAKEAWRDIAVRSSAGHPVRQALRELGVLGEEQ
jgi:hypothetical protein